MLIPDVYKQFHRLWSIQGSLFFGVLNGAVIGLSAFSDKIDPWLFLKLNVAGYAIIAALRLIKQAPHPDVPSTAPPSTVVHHQMKPPWPKPPPVIASQPPGTDPKAQEVLDLLKKVMDEPSKSFGVTLGPKQ
jgi:hypothetical protein